MNDGSGEKEIVPQDQTRNKNIPPPAETMNLVGAKRILQTVASTPANSFTETSDLDSVGEYSIQQVQAAIKVFCEHLMDKYGGKNVLRNVRRLNKDVPQGRLSLILRKSHLDPNIESAKLTLRVKLQEYVEKDVVSNSFLLTEDPEGLEPGLLTGFFDYRREDQNQSEVGFLSLLQKTGKIDDFRTMWKGIQWTAVNMLNWDQPSVIMPEKLAGQSSRVVEGIRPLPSVNRPIRILRNLIKKAGIK